MSNTADFEQQRPALLALAYRMLGDFGRAEELVQESWLRWQRCVEPVDCAKAYLIKVVTRLCLNELASARARREESRPARLPEPVAMQDPGLSRVELLDQVSMAFLVLLQRLTPAERAALLLHDVFDFDHGEIATLLDKTEPASRQLLKRARDQVRAEKRTLAVSQEEHRRLLRAFLGAASTGDVRALEGILARDVVLLADAGPAGASYGRARNLPGPLLGRTKVAAFVAAVGPQGGADVQVAEHRLNGQPAIVVYRNGQPITAIMLAVCDGMIRSVFLQADVERLSYVPPVEP